MGTLASLVLFSVLNMPIGLFKSPQMALAAQIGPDTVLSVASDSAPESNDTVMKDLTITAYSSTPDQTDSTPFTTASGSKVEAGIVASNFLPFGTQIKIPRFFGDQVFTVQDRMAKRFSNRVDIWFPSRNSAEQFGIQKADIVVLN